MKKINWRKWAPTTKWWTASIVATGTLVGMFWVGDGVNTDEEKLVLIGILVERATAYATRNKKGDGPE